MKGILMKPDMIQATVDLRKTVTRRVVKFRKPPNPKSSLSVMGRVYSVGDMQRELELIDKGIIKISPSIARYQVGETVYIKEAWWQGNSPTYGKHCVVYDSDKQIAWHEGTPFDHPDLQKDFLKKSPLFMPAWAARHFLKITGVSAGRVQEITEAEAIAEGCINTVMSDMWPNFNISIKPASLNYQDLWNSINAKPKPVRVNGIITHYESYPWEEGSRVETYRGKPHYIYGNPFVWVYSFKMIDK